MRVTFQIEGGAAHFPGLARPVHVDTDDLHPDEAEQLRTHVRAARLLHGGADRKPRAPVPDGRRYTMTIDAGEGPRTVHLFDPVEDPDAAALLALLRRYQRRVLAARQR